MIAAAVALIAWVLYTLVFVFLHWSWFISDMINAYKKKQDLLSGGCALMLLFLTLIVTTCFPAFAGMPEEYVTFANTLSSFFVAAMSAMIGLIGVQYTIAMQEKNRKEDLRRASKPYFVVDAWSLHIPGQSTCLYCSCHHSQYSFSSGNSSRYRSQFSFPMICFILLARWHLVYSSSGSSSLTISLAICIFTSSTSAR